MNKVFSPSMSMVLGMVLLTGCQHVTKEPVVVDKIASVEASQTQTLVNIKDVFDLNHISHCFCVLFLCLAI